MDNNTGEFTAMLRSIMRSKYETTEDGRLPVLWDIIGSNIVCSMKDERGFFVNVRFLSEQLFCDDKISYNLLAALVKRYTAGKIILRQLQNGACDRQEYSDLTRLIGSVKNPQIIGYPGSNFIVLLNDASISSSDLEMWVFDLRITF